MAEALVLIDVSKNDEFGKYLALRTCATRDEGLRMILHLCLARRPRLKAYESWNPSPPLILRKTKPILGHPVNFSRVFSFVPPKRRNKLVGFVIKVHMQQEAIHRVQWDCLSHYFDKQLLSDSTYASTFPALKLFPKSFFSRCVYVYIYMWHKAACGV